jgi:hypothetical protein
VADDDRGVEVSDWLLPTGRRECISSIVIDPFPASAGIFLVQIFCENPRCELAQPNENVGEHAANEVQRFLNVELASSCCVLLNGAERCRKYL